MTEIGSQRSEAGGQQLETTRQVTVLMAFGICLLPSDLRSK